VAHVQISGNSTVADEQIAKLAQVSVGTTLFRVSTSAVKFRIESHPWIRYAYVQRRIPDTIEIRVHERIPVAAVRCDELILVTSDSIVVAPLAANWVWDLPILTPPRPIKLREGKALTDAPTLALLREVNKVRAVSMKAWRDLSELYYVSGQIRATMSHPQVELIIGTGASELSWIGALDLLHDQNVPVASFQTLDLRIPGKVISAQKSYESKEQVNG